MNKIAAGAVAGLAATLPMTASMLVMHQAVPEREREPLPPEEITEKVTEAVGLGALKQPGMDAMTMAAHLGYGAAAGALYGAVAEKVPAHPVVTGIGFGLLVWTGSYLGWLPAAGILRPATEQPASENALMLAAHVVWGSALGLLADRLMEGEK